MLDGLRQPMEDGRVIIARATMSVRYPARFTLVGATNPCPCGRLGDPTGTCTCSATDTERYASRISGPLIDRIDMRVNAGAIALRELSGARTGETSAVVRDRVSDARDRQRKRFHRLRGVTCNAYAPGRWIDANAGVSTLAREFLQTAANALSLSARGYHRVLKVARTVADLDGVPSVEREHVAEALRYRPAIRSSGSPSS